MSWTSTEFWVEGYAWGWPLLIYLCGLIASIDAIWNGRTSQGTLAWVTTLTFIPFIALPLYLLFGSPKFHGYKKVRKASDKTLQYLQSQQALFDHASPCKQKSDSITPLEALARLPQSEKNDVHLLINGEQTFANIFLAIKEAQHFILIQFYIVNDDKLGRRLQKALIDKANQGIKICFLCDQIGSSGLNQSFLKDMEKAGIKCSRFNSPTLNRRLQINFRNHKKLLIIDGETCFIGGHNVGDEYLGRDPGVGLWRDTHLQIDGPATLAAQLSFTEDWYWANNEMLNLNWQAYHSEKSTKALIIASGPADQIESMSLSFVHLIVSAKKRIWLATPYFVPDLKVMGALQLAALKGIDIRILLPEKTDSLIIDLAMRNYVNELSKLGIVFLKYQIGFMHQKVMLIDTSFSFIGSANLDNRSLRLNFELNAVIESGSFACEVETMLQSDFDCSMPYSTDSNFLLTLSSKAARLLSPIL